MPHHCCIAHNSFFSIMWSNRFSICSSLPLALLAQPWLGLNITWQNESLPPHLHTVWQLFSKELIVGKNSSAFALSNPVCDLLCAADGAAGWMKTNFVLAVIEAVQSALGVQNDPIFSLMLPFSHTLMFCCCCCFQRYSKDTRQHTCTTGIKWVLSRS